MTRARAAGLTFTPRLFSTAGGATWTEHVGRLWELQEWLPGEADYHRRPAPAKLWAACAALARLLACWQSMSPANGPCPALIRRMETVREWRELVQSGWRPQPRADDPGRPAAA